MDCPRCGTTRLSEGSHEGARALLCERCGGCLLERRSLLSVLDAMARELRPDVGADAVLDPTPGPEDELDCPDCRDPMERYGYMGSRKIMIDGCDPCERLWLDAGELVAMARVHVRHDKRMERFEMSARPADLVGLQMASRSTEAALMAGALLVLRAMFLS